MTSQFTRAAGVDQRGNDPETAAEVLDIAQGRRNRWRVGWPNSVEFDVGAAEDR
ncbi:hypothetical protein [Nocardia testacea]|uniref:Uncharacterized protein n=1 Tax=Nocardia testacea TaxID=248551 RepID=A0ABW7VW25_9NOCA